MTTDAGADLPLDGVRVIDLTARVGAYCGKLLADVGADVIKVEMPAGDEMRRKPPFVADGPDGERSLLFAYYNNNKRGITLDWTSVDSQPILERLCATADVVLISPDSRRPLVGLQDAPPFLPWRHVGTILCSITPYGLTGPWRHWRATPFTSFASSGQMSAVGPVDGPPLAMPGQQLYDEASTRAAIAIDAALSASSDHRDQTIDISAHHVGAWQQTLLHQYGIAGRIQSRATNFGPPPGGGWQCKDGFVDIAAHGPHHWDLFVEMLDNPEDLSDELYRDRGMRIQLFDMLTGMIELHMREQSAPEFVERAQKLGLPCSLMYRPDEFVDDVQPASRHTFVQVDHPVMGTLTMPGPGVRGSGALTEYRRPAPTLGAANRDVYIDELGFDSDAVEKWAANGLI